ncbi:MULTISPECIES: acyltransferase family protein [Brucella/Ochrobactrum group]|uniref:Acyltransferase n=1 Tax=Brucella pseudintermedia TaxID=370111 RepID=A0ABY5U8U5_9HYPH|nr:MULTISPECIES: acyltransferase [Brucella/Ochrobactrum group]KAB2682633.1 acyltransferase [Brucella pseudintermedia]MCO7725096.1 acyltransferase [Brucella intermedia]NKE76124.1 acyltransferase [Ochrobactrum sp. MC-1LL]TWH00303.1 peptidoglycan/LPS O-acetylase OafA/YrhL [Ochrobactrum sp. J50]UWL59755.1 acyltransferase [Brucella pseudintermedia]
MSRLPDFDGLRFLLCIGIAVFHFSFRIPVKNEALNEFILAFSYFTDIFFIVSGLFLARRRNYLWNWPRYVAFVGKRLARIYPLHVLAFSCFALLSILTAAGILHPLGNPSTSWLDGLTQLLLIHNWGLGSTSSYNYVSWSLSALFAMYLAFPLFDMLCRRFGSWVLVGVIVAAIGGEYLAQKLGVLSLTRIQISNVGVFRTLPSFLFGMWLARREHPVMPRAAVKSLLAVCLAVFLFCHPYNGPGEPHTLEGPLRLAFVYTSVYVLYLASVQGIYTPLQWRVLAKLSRYSFGIFILHPLVGMMFFRMAPERWSETTAGAVLTICGAAVASVLIAAAAYHLFENPLHRRLVKRIDAWLARYERGSAEITQGGLPVVR